MYYYLQKSRPFLTLRFLILNGRSRCFARWRSALYSTAGHGRTRKRHANLPSSVSIGRRTLSTLNCVRYPKARLASFALVWEVVRNLGSHRPSELDANLHITPQTPYELTISDDRFTVWPWSNVDIT